MDKKSVDQLRQLTEKFYNQIFDHFNTTRQFYWDGWKKLMVYLQGETPADARQALKVLDLGCGNGRWGKYLARKKTIDYFGTDQNSQLLIEAKINVPEGKFIEFDLLSKWPKLANDFDLVGLMAVLHHIPGKKNRLKVLKKAKQCLKKDGLLVFTGWHFNKFKRFNQYVIKPEQINLRVKLEKNDYILDWKKGKTAYRYVHLFDDDEIAWLVKELKMKKVDEFVSDGRQGQGNRYVVLKKYD